MAYGTNSARLIARHPLNNGLTLEFWDHSRPVAGDRWYVHLETRICIPLRTDTLPPELKTHSDQVRGALGGEIIFSQQEARNLRLLNKAKVACALSTELNSS